MKIDKNFFLLCENFISDDKQRVSLINLYDIIWAENLPAAHPKLLYVMNLRITDSGDNDSLNVEYVVKSPSGKDLFPVQSGITKVLKNTKVQSVGGTFEVIFVPFTEFGPHNAILKVNDKVVAEHIFDVKPPIGEEL